MSAQMIKQPPFCDSLIVIQIVHKIAEGFMKEYQRSWKQHFQISTVYEPNSKHWTFQEIQK